MIRQRWVIGSVSVVLVLFGVRGARADIYNCEPEEDWLQSANYQCPPGACVYVDNSLLTSCDSRDGTHANGYCTIGEGISAADEGMQVVVRDGLYTGYKTCNSTGEPCYPECKPCTDTGLRYNVRHIVSKDLIIRSENGPQATIIDIEEDGWGFEVRSDATIEGFTIRNASTNGGIWVSRDGAATIRGNILEGNNYGAVNATNNYDVTIVGNIIRHNTSSQSGAGISSCADGRIRIMDNCVAGNATIGGKGGGIFVSGSEHEVEITGNLIAKNASFLVGGGVYVDSSLVSIEDCEIGDNTSQNGGGGLALEQLYAGQGVALVNCAVWGNEAGGNGGGIWMNGRESREQLPVPLDVTNCLIAGNYAAVSDGGGGGLSIIDRVALTISNSTIADNGALDEGGGIHASGSAASVDMRNSILWGNSATSGAQFSVSNITLSGAIVEGGAEGTCVRGDDPEFRAPAGQYPAEELGNYRLGAESPAIDWGNLFLVPDEITTDLDGGPRVVDVPGAPSDPCSVPEWYPPVDLGAYEFQLIAVSPIPDPRVPDNGFGTRNRYLSFSAGSDPGASEAMRIRFVDLPAPFDAYEGDQWWVGEPVEITIASGSNDSTPPPTFWAASLECNATPFYTDWTQYGVVHVFDAGIVPDGTYDVRAISEVCDPEDPAYYSPALTIKTSVLGDIVGNNADAAPQGVVDFVDISAVVAKFKNSPGAVKKSQADVIDGTLTVPDQKVDFVDISTVVGSFSGIPVALPGPETHCP